MYSLIHFIFLLSVFLMIGVSPTFQQQQQLTARNKIEEFFYKRCFTQSSNAKVFDDLRSHSSDFMGYFKYTMNLLIKDKNNFCTVQRKHLKGRMEKITEDMDKCLSQEEKFLPSLIKGSFEGFLHFLCLNNGQFADSFFSSQGAACRKNLTEESEIDSCFTRIFPPFGNTLKKAELCHNIDTAKICFKQLLDKKCADFYAFQELNENFFKYVGEPCTKSASKSSTLNLNYYLIITIASTLLWSKN